MPISLDLLPSFWKSLKRESLELSDLREADCITYNLTQKMLDVSVWKRGGRCDLNLIPVLIYSAPLLRNLTSCSVVWFMEEEKRGREAPRLPILY